MTLGESLGARLDDRLRSKSGPICIRIYDRLGGQIYDQLRARLHDQLYGQLVDQLGLRVGGVGQP